MNLRYAHSPLARAIVGATLAASIVASVSSAFAKTCNFSFPTNATCQQGSSYVSINHNLVFTSAGRKYELAVQFAGGTVGAVAYGIDVNGNHLNRCATSAADDDPNPLVTRAVACSRLYGTSGTCQPTVHYDYPLDMRTTNVTVL